MNARTTMYKLQRALCARGMHIAINQRQHWCEETNRMATRFIVRDCDNNRVILESYRPYEIAIVLADLLNGGGDG